jgi:hypothetical protein
MSWLKTKLSWLKIAPIALWAFILKLPQWILNSLDWLVGVVERLVVLAVAFLTFYIGWLTFHGAGIAQKGAAKPPAAELLTALSENWKGLLLVLIPLFYRTARTFLERVQKFAGMEAPLQKHSEDPNKGE